MSFLSWFDNRTLFSCQFILATIFSILFLSMRRAYPTFRGIGSVALSLLLAVPGVLLFYMRGFVPDLLSTAIAGLVILSSFALFYRGVIQFLGDNQFLSLLLIVDAIALAFICFFGEVLHNVVAVIAAISLAVAFARGLIAYKLLQHAQGRTYMRLFGLTMALFALNSVWRLLFVAWHGAPANYMQRGTVESLPLALNLLYLCITGLFFMSMINNRVLALVRNESLQDPLTGTLNRRGIERRLEIESKRIARSGGYLSVALIDVDHFKVINDSAGHAAGDAAICQVTATIASQLRAYDTLGRFGGDEFLLILPQTSITDASYVLERITEAVRTLQLASWDFPVTLSIGLTEAVPREPIATTLARADKALYAAKCAGRDCSRILLQAPQGEAVTLDSALFVS